jgi:hypothetical protein
MAPDPAVAALSRSSVLDHAGLDVELSWGLMVGETGRSSAIVTF